jgi:hypothetical protein
MIPLDHAARALFCKFGKKFPRKEDSFACSFDSRVARWYIFKQKIPIWANF